MKNRLIIVLFLLGIHAANAQQNEGDLRALIDQHKGDSAEVNAFVQLSYGQPLDSLTWYAQRGLSLARRIGYKKGEADCLLILQNCYGQQGNFNQAIQANLDALAIYEDSRDHAGMANAHAMLQGIYREIGDYRKALSHAFLGLQIAEDYKVNGSIVFPGHRWFPLLLAEIGQTYVLMNKLDSALFFTKKSIAQNELFNGTTWEFPIYLLATILNRKGEYKPALEKYREALVLCVPNGIPWDTLQIYSGMSTLFKNARQYDSTIHYAKIVEQGWKSQSEFKNLLEAVSNLAQAYKAIGNKDSALKYTERSYAIKDTIFNTEKDREIQQVAFNAKLKEEEMKTGQEKYKSRMQIYALIAGLLVLLFLSVVLWQGNRQKQKAKAKIERAYAELKSTQAQLIQREKMASLGELTAGIAHEIQNPLNFINNFSDINIEILAEVKEEIGSGKKDAVLQGINAATENLQKILHHGRRADAIVKGMLEHSRTSKGEKQSTDINTLAEDYLRLSYHGMRVRDKSFDAVVETQLDKTVDNIDVVPQEIGRVLLNLFNNAFYAVSAKKRQLNGPYEPVVNVCTRKESNSVVIVVKDNGTGIPENAKEKVFQPFFTTKPPGEGTGLGLSLSYDMVKAHGGELKVESEEGEGAAFVIRLPLDNSQTMH